MGEKAFIKTIQKAKPERMEYYPNISDNKKKRKFIEQIKRLIRSSMEYRDYIQFLRENIDMDSCAFFQFVTSNSSLNPDNKKIKIEIHHEPFTLDDLVATVLEKYIEEGLPIDSLDIAEEVMELHYKNQVGLIPLSKTIHEIVHNSGKIPIPLYMCYGAYVQFVRDYEPYLSKLGLMDKLERKIKATKEITAESFDAIRREFEYLEVEGRSDDLEKLPEEEETFVLAS